MTEFRDYIILDIETTGLSKHRHKITEIAAVKYSGKKKVDEFHSLVNPECNIPRFITRLTGIDDEMVKDAPKIDSVIKDFLCFCGDTPVVAHNSTFDTGFIRFNAEQFAKTGFENTAICTRRLASRIFPNLSSKSLSSVCEYLGVMNETAHRAMSDVLATADVFHVMLDKLELLGVNERAHIERFQKMPIKKCRELAVKED